jgi:hypothetical protein
VIPDGGWQRVFERVAVEPELGSLVRDGASEQCVIEVAVVEVGGMAATHERGVDPPRADQRPICERSEVEEPRGAKLRVTLGNAIGTTPSFTCTHLAE